MKKRVGQKRIETKETADRVSAYSGIAEKCCGKESRNMRTENTANNFIKYLVPSLGGAMVMSIYTMADSIVVGKWIGAEGLAALSLTAPPYCLLMAIGLLLGIGSSVHIGVRKGMGDQLRADEYFTVSAIMAVIAAVGMTALYNLCLDPIVRLMGAEGALYTLTFDYLKWLARFAFMLVPSMYLAAVLRADGDPNRAMAGVIAGGVINVGLDILLVTVIGIGIGGAAIASCAGILVQDLIFLSHFLSKKNTMHLVRHPRRKKSCVKNIVLSGISSFVNELANGFITLLLNRQILKYCGTSALSVYGVISNCVVLFNSFFSGVGQAVQPLVSYAVGGDRKEEMRAYRNLGLLTDIGFGLLFTAAGVLAPLAVSGIFVNVTDTLHPIITYAVPRYFAAFVPMAVNVFATYYLQSVLKESRAFLISVLRNIVLSACAIMVFPVLFGGDSLWITMPVVETAVLVISAVFLRASVGKRAA